jgi:hypothetical protein
VGLASTGERTKGPYFLFPGAGCPSSNPPRLRQTR